MLNKSILIGLFCCLTACSQTSELSASADNSENQAETQAKTFEHTGSPFNGQWKIEQGKLYANNKPIEWLAETIEDCILCVINQQRVMHPGGPLMSYQVMQNKQLRASYNEVVFPWIEVRTTQRVIRVPIVIDNASNELRLQLPQGSIPMKVQQRLSFRIEQQYFQLWIEKYQVNLPKPGHVFEQAEYQLKYLLLNMN